MRRTAALLTAVTLCALTLVGCSFGAQTCAPRLDISPHSAAPGDTVTVSTLDECDAEVPEEGWILLLAPVGSPEKATRTTVRSPEGSSFTAQIPVPVDMPVGEAVVSIENWDYPEACTATDSGCATASGGFVVEQYEGQGESLLLSSCIPGQIAVEADPVAPGERIVVTGAPGDCREAAEAIDLTSIVYRLALYDRSLNELAAVDAPLAADGSLRAEIGVPSEAPSGSALVEVTNFFDIVPCPPNGDCADVAVRLQLGG